MLHATFNNNMSQYYTIIAGVGPGTGAAIAKKFAQSYSVVLLGRTLANLRVVEQEITDVGGKAISIEADVSSRESMELALRTTREKLGNDYRCAVSENT